MMVEMKKIAFLNLVLGLVIALSMSSCAKDDNELIDVQAFTDSSIESLQKGAIGKNHCLEFVFPITIEFIDETTAEVEDYEALNDSVKAWFEENDVERSRENKPQLVFPIQVLNEEGEIIDVATIEDLKTLKQSCVREGNGRNGQRGKGFSCFDLAYPITVTIGGVDTIFDDSTELKEAIKAYKEAEGRDAERPSLVYPVTVVYEDGTEVTVADQEELQALKEDCKG